MRPCIECGRVGPATRCDECATAQPRVRPGRPSQAAEQASTYVAAYCTRLRIGDPVPPVVEQIAAALALRMALNPKYLRGASAEGQSVDYPALGLTYFESTLLNRYRRRTA